MTTLLLLAGLLPAAAAISCYGDAGQPVDWFVAYKLPAVHNFSKGLNYMYLDGNEGSWQEGSTAIDSPQGAVGRTMNQLYQGNLSELAYLLYNDQPPLSYGVPGTTQRGHTKGVLLLNRDGGIWLIHSVPHFPPHANSSYSWPQNAWAHGQTLLCVTFSYNQFREIGKQLTYTYPQVYDYRLEGTFAQDLPELKLVAQGHHVDQGPWNRSVTLTSRAGAAFRSFAKFNDFQDDLYSGWLTSALRSDLFVQFWHKTTDVLPSSCSDPFHVLNVLELAFPNSAVPPFNATHDHAKWCVALNSTWTCIGDLNRNHAEEYRGGGTLCSQMPTLWKAFWPLVRKFGPCPPPRPKVRAH
ncbi:deoxyribonuclease-2-alpha isoform X1 [Sarcophilus harrisii]|uniref:deoxyribonuclease-2-alpha isoform X1 n=1 Tax=Sarcophilus harrisii TaxID=9305 RepID=UPI00062B34A3|nr:deoxyribonuclease-2-alpha isoform X1 [Sarcophilus harrisii]XP_023352524.1 deoxyribonuclease-2-alpha isoform X1 [Sarcophilus harrisii]